MKMIRLQRNLFFAQGWLWGLVLAACAPDNGQKDLGKEGRPDTLTVVDTAKLGQSPGPQKAQECHCQDTLNSQLSPAPKALIFKELSFLSTRKGVAQISPEQMDTYGKMLPKCHKWRLTSAQLAGVFRASRRISSEAWNSHFEVPRCGYSGLVIINGRTLAKYGLNAGSFFYLYFKDTTYIYGYYGDKYDFVSRAER
jgi:hypothetical protein